MDNENSYLRRRRRDEDARPDQMLKLRNWLNIIFMVGAVIGVGVYFFHDHQTGIIVVLASMVFKIVETALRLMK